MKTDPNGAYKHRCDAFEQSEKQRDDPSLATPKKKSCQKGANAYKQAYDEILSKFPEWRRKEIASFQANHDLDNRLYTEFVQEVVALGDEYSST